jgi:4-hydroxy-3-methylbut-2-enyl diphosphate reductase
MDVKLVKSAGFCFGVKRAVNLAMESLESCSNRKIYTMGEIIHNNYVVNTLKEKGIEPILNEKEILNIHNSIVILRSHGVKKEILEKLRLNNNVIIDAICPFVKKIHSYVDMLTSEKYFVVIVGDKNHPEVVAISSFADKKNSAVISSAEEVKKLKRKNKIGVVTQTTQDIKNFLEISEELLKNKGEIRVFNSICNATSRRQKESLEVAKDVDIMLVIGGKQSANTKRLFEICKVVNNDTFHVENSSEIKEEWFENKKIAGITAGASTPDVIISEVIDKIKEIK